MYLNELYRFSERMGKNSASGMPPEGMSSEQIAFALVVNEAGDLASVRSLQTSDGKTRRYPVPFAATRSSNVLPNCLWDNTGYVLGIESGGKLSEKKSAAFRELHERLFASCEDIHARALLSFLRKWRPEQLGEIPERDMLLGSNVVFQLQGEDIFFHQVDALRKIALSYLHEEDGDEQGTCLVSGRNGTIVPVHPSIKGVVGAQSSGAAIVSFNCDSFISYGKTQSFNAPTSGDAARAYVNALNYLLQRDHRQMVRIGDTCMVFWAEKSTPAETLFGEFFDVEPVSGPQDKAQVDKLKGILTALRNGQPLNDAVADLDGSVRFFVLGLAPNAARLSVRFWLTDTLEVLLSHFARWYEDLHIERQFPESEPEYPSLWLLLARTVAALGKTENIPAELAGQLARCMLTARRFPESVYTATIQRVHADKKVDYYRAALIKAYLCRNSKWGENNMEALNKGEENIGYRLGRLFALLEKAQRDALGGDINAPLRERYIGAASATPRVVFPMLLRLAQHHVTKARKGQFSGYETFFSRTLEEITTGMVDFPAVLSLQDQGRFMLGYYHQNNAFYQKKNNSEKTEA